MSGHVWWASPREDQHAALVTALVAELQTARLVPAVFVPGAEHQDAPAIVRTGLPSVVHQRRTLQWRLDEHLFLDAAAGTGVRVLACWDDRAHRVRMCVAEIGERGLWDRIVAHFTAWEMTGQPVPSATAHRGLPVFQAPVGLAGMA